MNKNSILSQLKKISKVLNPICSLVVDNYSSLLLENKELYLDYLFEYSELWRTISLNESELIKVGCRNLGHSWAWKKESAIKFISSGNQNNYLIHCGGLLGINLLEIVESTEDKISELENEIYSLNDEDYFELSLYEEIEDLISYVKELIEIALPTLIEENEIFVFDDTLNIQEVIAKELPEVEMKGDFYLVNANSMNLEFNFKCA